MTEQEIIANIKDAFDHCTKPKVLVVADNDLESLEHQKMWDNRTRESLGFADVFVQGMYPYNALTVEGMMYFFPAIVSIVTESKDALIDGEWCGIPLVLSVLGKQPNEFMQHCNDSQKKAVIDLIGYILEHKKYLIPDEEDLVAVQRVYDVWKTSTSY